jgi:hypothetical protein
MKIQDLFEDPIPSKPSSLGVGGTIKAATGNAGASLGQMAKTAALKGLGFKNTADAYQQKNKIGQYADQSQQIGGVSQNPSQLVQQLGLKQGMDFEVSPGVKVRIDKIDNTGAQYTDPNTKLPVTLGSKGLGQILQTQQALQRIQ